MNRFTSLVAATTLFAATQGAAFAAETGNNLVLKVNGMVCSYCAQGIEKRLKSMSQTQAVYVNLAQKTVAVDAKPGQKFDAAKVKAEVVEAGYEVASLETTAKTTSQIKAELVAKK
jgi:periplasmic mercuric ion binding protein